MEDAYEALRRDGHNTVENIIQWLKDAKVIEAVQVTEEEARVILAGIVPQQEGPRAQGGPGPRTCERDVNFDQFKEFINALAKEYDRCAEEICMSLAQAFPPLLSALDAAARAFEETLASTHDGTIQPPPSSRKSK